MINLFLTIFCSTSIALLLKFNETKKGEPMVLLSGNYFTAGIIGGIFTYSDSNAVFSGSTLIFGIFLGLLFLLSFFAFAKSVESVGTPLSSVSSRLSVVIPVLFSMFIYKELPETLQTAGIILSLVTIIFFYLSIRKFSLGKFNLKDFVFPILLFIGIGINDFALKVFERMETPAEEPYFIMFIFIFAFIFSFGYSLISKIKIDSKTFVRGMLLGIPNIFSTFFLLNSLQEIDAVVVYPAVNIGVILLTTFIAFLLWKERLNNYGLLALVTGISAIVLLVL